jgi:hypothetical protein
VQHHDVRVDFFTAVRTVVINKKTFITTVLTAVKKKNQHTRPRLMRLVDATKEAEETATAAEAAAALSPPEEAQVLCFFGTKKPTHTPTTAETGGCYKGS